MSRTMRTFIIALVLLAAALLAAPVAPIVSVSFLVPAAVMFGALAMVVFARRARSLAPYASLARRQPGDEARPDRSADMTPGEVSGPFVIGLVLLGAGLLLSATAPSGMSDTLLMLGGVTVTASTVAMIALAWRARGRSTAG